MLIVEVLSPSTADHDRGSKFAHYRAIPSLRDYVLVAQDEVRVEHFAAEADGTWRFSETRDPAAVIDLPAVGCSLPVGEIYEGLFAGR